MNAGTLEYVPSKKSWKISARPDVKLKLKRIFAQSSASADTVNVTHTLEAAADLVWILERWDLKITTADRARLEEGAAEYRVRSQLIEAFWAGTVDTQPFELAKPPYGYQKIGAELCYRFRGALIADELGLGKTVTAICLLSLADTRPALVVVPPALTWQWRDRLQEFAPNLSAHIVEKSKPYELLQPSRTGIGKYPDVIIVPYSKLPGWSEPFLGALQPKTVVFDEIQYLRSEDTERYRIAKAISEVASWRMGLSATPIHNQGHEFFPVMQILRPGELGERHEYIREWCGGATDSRGRSSISVPEAFGSFLRTNGMMLRRTRKDAGVNLPEMTRVFHEVSYDKKRLNEVVKPAAELAKIILAETEISRGDRLRASGELDMLVRQATGVSKAVAVADFTRLLLESEEKIVLYGYHHAVYDIWRDRLKDLRPLFYTGQETPATKREHEEAFVSGDARLLIMSVRAGIGLDGLQGVCRTMVVGEFDWSPAVHEQNEGRLDRPGQTHPVFAYYCHVLEGSDPDVIALLRDKRKQSAGVLSNEGEMFANIGDKRHVRELALRYLKKARAA